METTPRSSRSAGCRAAARRGAGSSWPPQPDAATSAINPAAQPRRRILSAISGVPPCRAFVEATQLGRSARAGGRTLTGRHPPAARSRYRRTVKRPFVHVVAPLLICLALGALGGVGTALVTNDHAQP